MGLPRVFMSAAAILFGTFMYYVAMHYVPALASPQKMVRLATESQTIPVGIQEFQIEDPSIIEKLLGPYYSLFALDRSYKGRGETIQIKFDVPETAIVHLDIVQCRRIWAVEIFKCKVIKQFGTTKGPGRGIAKFKLGDEGFYHFRHRIDGLSDTDTYRVIWERV